MDGLLIIGINQNYIENFKFNMIIEFDMIDLGGLNQFHGLQIYPTMCWNSDTEHKMGVNFMGLKNHFQMKTLTKS